MSVIERALDFLRRRRHNYRVVFDNPPGLEVLADLAKFCRAHETTFHADPRIHAVLEGRREVWIRLQNHLRLTEDELWKLYGEAKKNPGQGPG